MGILEVLTLIFVTLKLMGIGDVAMWSWWWVFSPLWIGYGIALVVWFVGFLFVALVGGRR